MLSEGNDNSLLRYTLGSVCFKEGRLDEAVNHLENALSQDAKHSASWKLYGRALVKLSRADDAVNAYEQGIAVAEEKGDVQAAKEMNVFLKRLKK